jgi:hypothetical protein
MMARQRWMTSAPVLRVEEDHPDDAGAEPHVRHALDRGEAAQGARHGVATRARSIVSMATLTACVLALSSVMGCSGAPDESTAGTMYGDADVIGAASTSSSVVFPLEVLGPQGTFVTATFNLTNVSSIAQVAIVCHACGYDDIALDSNKAMTKGSLRVNNGSPIALKRYTGGGTSVGNSNIVLPAAAAAYGGIGGGFHTLRFTLPITGLVNGANQMRFEHTNASTVSLGYRILDIAFLRADGTAITLPSGSVTRDNPASWQPIRPSEIAAGKTLWSKRDILNDPGIDALNGTSTGGAIHASCADCHAADGRDLKYFNYSDRSIIKRAMFHNLSVVQGEQIASYIRSINIPVVPTARPWNPPYQPGPGLDSKPVYQWAAGAGIESVLAKDADMQPFLFPNGVTAQAVRAVVDRFSTLNMRELPLALQFPDWNTWLPRLHPRDGFRATSAVILADEKGVPTSSKKPFFDVVYDAAVANPTRDTIAAMRIRLEDWIQRGATCFTQSENKGPPYRGVNGVVMAAASLPPVNDPLISGATECHTAHLDKTRMKRIELAKHGLAAWLSVKQWELVHSKSMEEDFKNLPKLNVKGTSVSVGERGWPLDGFSVFFRAPHYLAYNSREFLAQDAMVGAYESSAWYQLQLVLNPGYRRNVPPANHPNTTDPEMPSHFPYTIDFLESLARESKLADPFRFWATYIKIRQQQTNGHYGVENGLDLRTAQPYELYSSKGGVVSTRNIGQPLWGRIATAMIKDFVQDAAHATAADWANAANNSTVQPPRDPDLDFSPWNFANPPAGKMPFGNPDPVQGTNTFRVIPQLRNVVQVDDATLGDLITWANTMWPNSAWNKLR